jgi:hypothetical protein
MILERRQKKMKNRRWLIFVVAVVLLIGSLSQDKQSSLADDGTLILPPTPTATLNVTVDGAPLTVTNYRVIYVANPVLVWDSRNSVATYNYHTMNIYVPSNATEDSPIILQVNNGGWLGGQAGTPVTDGAVYTTTIASRDQKTAVALKAGYVVVNTGSRSRGMTDPAGATYVGHAPAVVVDVKAAIRYLRYNDAAMLGTTKRLLITGTSGGGGLSVAISASGNSPDYYPYLHAIGAAGVTYDALSDTYSSTLNDDVFGMVGYCPITDLDHADAAYEWMYNATREKLREEFGTYTDTQMLASAWLAADYVPYLNDLGLKDEGGNPLTANNLDDAIKAIVEKEIEEAYVEVGQTQMDADIATLTYTDTTWYSIDGGGNATLDLDKWLYFVVRNRALKTPPAFDNYKTPLQGFMNESNLAGTPAQEYSNFTEWAWNHNNAPGDGIGLDDTGLMWGEYILTDAGKAVLKQMDMVNPMPYLVSNTNGDNAPYWYYRHGMIDRDTSFAVEVALYYAVLNASGVSNVNFELAWLKPHGGDYDVPEAYEWVAEAVHNANTFDAIEAAMPSGQVTGTLQVTFTLPAGTGITYMSSRPDVVTIADGQAVVTPPKSADATVTITATVTSDEIAGDGYNYGAVEVTHAYTFTVPAAYYPVSLYLPLVLRQ